MLDKPHSKLRARIVLISGKAWRWKRLQNAVGVKVRGIICKMPSRVVLCGSAQGPQALDDDTLSALLFSVYKSLKPPRPFLGGTDASLKIVVFC